MGVDVSRFPVKEVSSTYNDRAFANMGYVLDNGVWVKKANYKPKVKPVSVVNSSGISSDDAQNSVLTSLLMETQDIKWSLGVVDTGKKELQGASTLKVKIGKKELEGKYRRTDQEI
ncbi:hypothetical protein HAX54_019456 [Datura stramonium]|uniref:Uncharacterized protein n=1 Tax=Datura stramonium TaxID=4076 RepID=A0ABS8UPZ4_DATST|nr:hypothetical protein [Datura stramonium]